MLWYGFHFKSFTLSFEVVFFCQDALSAVRRCQILLDETVGCSTFFSDVMLFVLGSNVGRWIFAGLFISGSIKS